jgi:hypothetical protein
MLQSSNMNRQPLTKFSDCPFKSCNVSTPCFLEVNSGPDLHSYFESGFLTWGTIADNLQLSNAGRPHTTKAVREKKF